MARKCRSRDCRAELPRKKDCTDPIQAGGFCCQTCMWAHVDMRRSEAAQRKARRERVSARERLKTRADHAREAQEGKLSKSPHGKTLKNQTRLTQNACNRLVRLLDDEKPCVSCGKHNTLEAGHFKSVGSTPELRFCLLNIHGQCRACNQAGTIGRKRGKNPETVASEYERRLRLRIGDEAVDWLKGPHPMPHYSVDDLQAMRKVFNAEGRRIERGDGPTWSWRELL